MDFAPASDKEFLDIEWTIECDFTLKHVPDMIRTYSLVTAVSFFQGIYKGKYKVLNYYTLPKCQW